jgi:hypothetical protein
MKGMINFSQFNCSYAHSALQSLCCLDFSKLYQLNYKYQYNSFFMISNELLNIINKIHSGNAAFSQDIINYYSRMAIMLYGNMPNNACVNSKDPFNFLNYLLEMLHYENNKPSFSFDINFLYNQNLMNQRNDDYMYFLYLSFFKQTQNSIISNYFFNIERYKTICPNCGTLYFYSSKNILEFELDEYRVYRDNLYPFKKFSNVTLDDCFKCYVGGNKCNCQNCGGVATKYTSFCSSTKVLIIYFHRIRHYFCKDIDYPFTLNISKYIKVKNNSQMNFNPVYNLKAIISYDQFLGKYFADCYVRNNFSFMGTPRGAWYRYIDDKVRLLGNLNFEFNLYEPQLLFYELQDNSFNGNFINPFNIMLNKMFPFYQQMFMKNNFNNFQMNMPNQGINFFQQQNLNALNIMSNNTKPSNPNPNGNINQFGLKFICVPEFGDQSETPTNKIVAQVSSNFKFKEAINNFYMKLVKPRGAIKKFLLNNNEISPDCESSLSQLNINKDTIIKAIKSPNLDQMKLVGS